MRDLHVSSRFLQNRSRYCLVGSLDRLYVSGGDQALIRINKRTVAGLLKDISILYVVYKV